MELTGMKFSLFFDYNENFIPGRFIDAEFWKCNNTERIFNRFRGAGNA